MHERLDCLQPFQSSYGDTSAVLSESLQYRLVHKRQHTQEIKGERRITLRRKQKTEQCQRELVMNPSFWTFTIWKIWSACMNNRMFQFSAWNSVRYVSLCGITFQMIGRAIQAPYAPR